MRAIYWYEDTDLLLGLEEPPLPVGCINKPVKLSPDWPPFSTFDLEMYEAKLKGRKASIEYILKKYEITL